MRPSPTRGSSPPCVPLLAAPLAAPRDVRLLGEHPSPPPAPAPPPAAAPPPFVEEPAAAASNRRLAPWVHGAMGSVLHASRLQHGLVAPPVVAYDAATSATVMPSAEATVMPGAIGDDATIVAAAQQQQHYREAAAATASSLRQPPMVVPTSSLSVAESVFGSRASAAATRRPKARPKVLELSAAHAVGACTSRAGSRAGFPPPPPATVHPTAFRSVADERAAAKDWEEGVPARRPPDRPTAASELKRAHGPVGFAGSADSLVGSWAQSSAAVGGGGVGLLSAACAPSVAPVEEQLSWAQSSAVTPTVLVRPGWGFTEVE